MKYAGIGSRDTSIPILNKMKELAQWAHHCGYTLRSGGADGADSAFEFGCDEVGGNKEIFLPWEGFNSNKSLLFTPTLAANELAKTIHPVYNRLPDKARLLIARNMHQILGIDLVDPVDCVICYNSTGQDKLGQYNSKCGGTGSAIQLACLWNIPIFNLYHYEKYDEAYEFLESHKTKEDIIYEL